MAKKNIRSTAILRRLVSIYDVPEQLSHKCFGCWDVDVAIATPFGLFHIELWHRIAPNIPQSQLPDIYKERILRYA